MARYVKFLRGTPLAYQNAVKQDDTLYFISEADDTNVSLYLGSKLVAGGDDLELSSIDALKDVLINEGLENHSFLVYDEGQKLWINKSFNDAIPTFIGATETKAGIGGLIPAPELGQTNLFLRSDGNWVTIEGGNGTTTSINIINITNDSNKTHDVIIQEAIADTVIAKGDIIVITDIIINDITQQSAYVYDGIEWIKLNDNLVNEKQVIFVDDLTGLETSGKNLKDVLELILAKPEVSADNLSISMNNNVMSLKNYGVQYYRFVAATDTVEAHYELQLVDDEHPWKAGLESRTIEEDGQIVIGWYEPNLSTLDGVNTQITELQNAVGELDNEISNKADKTAVYTKEETESLIAAAAHLKRKEVDSIDDIDVTAADADQYIYMVPSGLQVDDNKYYEYIVVEIDVVDEESGETTKAKKIERVGSWEVNLNDYAKKTEVNDALAGKVDKVDGSFLMTQAQSTKLEKIEAGAQVNAIDSVDGTFFTIKEDKTLTLNKISITQVTNLEELLNNKVDKKDNERLITNDEAEKLNALAKITAVSSDFEIVNGVLNLSLSETSTLATKSEVTAIANRVDGLEAAATWGELK